MATSTTSETNDPAPQNSAVDIDTETARSSPLLPEVREASDGPLRVLRSETEPEPQPRWGARTGDAGGESSREAPRPAHEALPHGHAFHRVDSHRCGNSQHAEAGPCSRVCMSENTCFCIF